MIAQAIKTRMEIPRPLFAAFPGTIIAFSPREGCDAWDTLWDEKTLPEDDLRALLRAMSALCSSGWHRFRSTPGWSGTAKPMEGAARVDVICKVICKQRSRVRWQLPLTSAEQTPEETGKRALTTFGPPRLLNRALLWGQCSRVLLNRGRRSTRCRGRLARRRLRERGLINPTGCAAFQVLDLGKARIATNQSKWPSSRKAIQDRGRGRRTGQHLDGPLRNKDARASGRLINRSAALFNGWGRSFLRERPGCLLGGLLRRDRSNQREQRCEYRCACCRS